MKTDITHHQLLKLLLPLIILFPYYINAQSTLNEISIHNIYIGLARLKLSLSDSMVGETNTLLLEFKLTGAHPTGPKNATLTIPEELRPNFPTYGGNCQQSGTGIDCGMVGDDLIVELSLIGLSFSATIVVNLPNFVNPNSDLSWTIIAVVDGYSSSTTKSDNIQATSGALGSLALVVPGISEVGALTTIDFSFTPTHKIYSKSRIQITFTDISFLASISTACTVTNQQVE